MYGPFQKARHVLRGGAALVLALLLCAAMPARAAGVTAGGADQDTSARMLVPVGHTVGIKLFARGVMVVKAPESTCRVRKMCWHSACRPATSSSNAAASP